MVKKSMLSLGSILVAFSVFLIIGVNMPTLDNDDVHAPDPQLGIDSYVIVEVFRPINGQINKVYHFESHNVITNVGLHVIERLLGGGGTWNWTAAQGGTNKYYSVDEFNDIAVSSDSTGVNATHSSWQPVDGSYPSNIEITTGGLQRGSGTLTMDVSYTPGTGSTMGSVTYTMSRVFTVESGFSFTGVQKAGLFAGPYNENDGSASGSGYRISPLVAENTFTPVDLNPGDSIAISWSITIG